MTTFTPDTSGVHTALPAYPLPQRVTQFRVLRSELTKLRTQPSTFWSLLAAVILVTGFGVVYSLIRETRPPHGAAAFATFDPVGVSLSGVQLAQIAVGILGVLLITSEYATGMIRTTLSAVPGRLPVLWGKAILVAAATFAVSLPAALAAFVGGQSILAKQHLSVPLSQPGAVRAVVGSALYLAAIALLGLGLGALLRSTAAGIAALFGLLFGVQLVVGLLPWQWSQEAAKFAPTTAGQAVTTASPDPAYSLPPWAGLGVLVLYAVVLLGFAALRMRRGDA